MTLDEMIRLLREIDEEEREEAYTAIFPPYADKCTERAENCKQLADWLEELKDYRRFNGAKTFDNGFNQGEKYGYNKAIDDFTEKIVGYGTYDYYGNVIDVLEIANELKEHKTLNIVHCKDCKHWGTGIAGETENVKCCEYGKYMIGANGYCVFGEKRSVQNEINRC